MKSNTSKIYPDLSQIYLKNKAKTNPREKQKKQKCYNLHELIILALNISFCSLKLIQSIIIFVVIVFIIINIIIIIVKKLFDIF